MAILQYTTPSQISTITIGNSTYRYGKRARVGGFFMRDVATGEYATLPSEAAVRWMIGQLTDVAERARISNWAASMLLYIAANRKPAPMPTPPAACMGWQAAHYNLPEELQNAPAVAYIGARHVCQHCKDAHDRAMAHLAGLQQQAASIPVYETVAVAAQDSHMTENTIKIGSSAGVCVMCGSAVMYRTSGDRCEWCAEVEGPANPRFMPSTPDIHKVDGYWQRAELSTDDGTLIGEVYAVNGKWTYRYADEARVTAIKRGRKFASLNEAAGMLIDDYKKRPMPLPFDGGAA